MALSHDSSRPIRNAANNPVGAGRGRLKAGYGPPGWYLVGGTSASSAQVAGVVALANQARAAAHKAPIGDLNKAIYSQGFDKSAAFNDIVPQTYGDGSVPSAHLQSNQVWDIAPGVPLTLDSVTGHATTVGYDLVPGTFSVPARYAKHMMVTADIASGDAGAIQDALEAAWELQRSAG